MSHHKEQYASLLKKELARFFDHNIPRPDGVLISVTNVYLDDAALRATVMVSIYPDANAKEIFASLKEYEAEAHRYLADVVQRKKLPFIVFELDVTQEARLRLEKLLDTI